MQEQPSRGPAPQHHQPGDVGCVDRQLQRGIGGDYCFETPSTAIRARAVPRQLCADRAAGPDVAGDPGGLLMQRTQTGGDLTQDLGKKVENRLVQQKHRTLVAVCACTVGAAHHDMLVRSRQSRGDLRSLPGEDRVILAF